MPFVIGDIQKVRSNLPIYHYLLEFPFQRAPPPPTQKGMFKLSDASGKLTFSTISQGSLNQGALDSKDVFLVDGGKELFVWVGQGMDILIFNKET